MRTINTYLQEDSSLVASEPARVLGRGLSSKQKQVLYREFRNQSADQILSNFGPQQTGFMLSMIKRLYQSDSRSDVNSTCGRFRIKNYYDEHKHHLTKLCVVVTKIQHAVEAQKKILSILTALKRLPGDNLAYIMRCENEIITWQKFIKALQIKKETAKENVTRYALKRNDAEKTMAATNNV